MGWLIKYTTISQRDHLRQENARAATHQLVKKHDVQILYT